MKKDVNMEKENFVYSFTSSKSPEYIFALLLDIEQWWSGLYGETIKGESRQLNDEFIFEAGGGMHNTRQKLVELIPDKRIAWMVTDSRLTFLKDPTEWANTNISFDISRQGDSTKVTFTHDGLTPHVECYDQCSAGWTGYLNNLTRKLR